SQRHNKLRPVALSTDNRFSSGQAPRSFIKADDLIFGFAAGRSIDRDVVVGPQLGKAVRLSLSLPIPAHRHRRHEALLLKREDTHRPNFRAIGRDSRIWGISLLGIATGRSEVI